MNALVRDSDRLSLDEVERLHDVAAGLLADRGDGVAYPTDRSRRAADAFVTALCEEPAATLRALQLRLQRVKLDVRENGRFGGDYDA